MAKDKGATSRVTDSKTAGYPKSGDDVYYFLTAGPNAGKPRPAKIIRAKEPVPRENWGVLDLKVASLPEDECPDIVRDVKPTPVGSRKPGTWDWQEPEESGY